jgi:putative oxidoreductase
MQDAGKLLLRFTVGVLMLMHGIAKVVSGPAAIIGLVERAGLPGAFGYLVYVGEVLAPLMLIAGWWTRLAGAIVAVHMAVAVLLVHTHNLLQLGRGGGWALELEGIFFFTAVAIALIGPGRYSIDGR